MRTFETTATQQLGLLWYIFMVGNVFLMLPGGIPANACGTELLYQRVVLANYFLVRATFAATRGHRTFDADREAVAGLGSIAAKWKRVSLRGMLFLAVATTLIHGYFAVCEN